jgi:hypothetical protein
MNGTYNHNGNEWTLNGDALTGDTFADRGWIKAYVGGKWDANFKCWRVDVARFDSMVARHVIAVSAPAPAAVSGTSTDGICPKCHSYCFGDCSAR